MKRATRALTLLLSRSAILPSLLFSAPVLAETFPLGSSPIIGELRETRSRHEDTLIDIAREFNLGYDQIVKANPTVNRWVPGDGNNILLPSKYLLPDAPRTGLVVNVAELRLYYYLPQSGGESRSVVTFPVSIGRMDWKTPLGETSVVKKDKNPPWYPTASIKAEHARDGDPLPDMIPGGHPENPLGGFALRLGIPGYLIHGVDERKANGIGMRVTHGCMRMYPEDVANLFEIVPVKTRVMLVNQPIKVATVGDNVYVQITTPLREDGHDGAELPIQQSLSFIRSKVGAEFQINEEKAIRAIEQGNGLPVIIGRRTDSIVQTDYPTRPTPSRETRSLERSMEDGLPRGGADERPYRRNTGRETVESSTASRGSRYDYDEEGRPLSQRESTSQYERNSGLSVPVRRAPALLPRSGAAYREELPDDRDDRYYREDNSGRSPDRSQPASRTRSSDRGGYEEEPRSRYSGSGGLRNSLNF